MPTESDRLRSALQRLAEAASLECDVVSLHGGDTKEWTLGVKGNIYYGWEILQGLQAALLRARTALEGKV